MLKRQAVLALSFANLCFFKTWWELLAFQKREEFYFAAPPGAAHFWAVILNVIALGLVVFLVSLPVLFSRNHTIHKVARILFLAFLLIPLSSIVRALAKKYVFLHFAWWLLPDANHLRLILLNAGLIATLLAIIKFRSHVVDSGQRALLVLFPLFPILLAQGIWTSFHTPPGLQYPPLSLSAPKLEASSPASSLPRVVWVIFDEWDYATSFLDAAMRQRMPEIAHFASNAVVARSAFPPGAHTAVSVPGLLTGRLVARSEPLGPSELMLIHEGQPSSVWGREDTIFSALRTRHAHIAVSGFLFPYTRIFGSVAACTECDIEPSFTANGTKFAEIARNQFRSIVEVNFKSPWGQSLDTLHFRHCYETVTRSGIRNAADPQYDFVFLHLPVPHSPHFYNSQTGKMDLSGSPASGYLDALVLLDHTAHELRAAMEKAGLWDRTTVVYSSDHWNRHSAQIGRPTDHHIPFLLKLAGQNEHREYTKPFNTVLTRALLEHVIDGKVSTSSDAVQWLDAHRGTLAEATYHSWL